MKKALSFILLLLTMLLPWGLVGADGPQLQSQPPAPPPQGQCPKTKIVGQLGDCLRCHTAPSFHLKEAPPDEVRSYPVRKMRAEETKGYLILEEINCDDVQQFLDYLWDRGIRHAVIEIHSPGGSLFGAWKIVGLMRYYQARGMVIETRCYGFAASAGFLIFASGSKGHRFAARTAEFMWHELLLAQFGLRVTTPSSSEEESRILRHLQDTANGWLASVSCMSKEQIDEAIRKKEMWVDGHKMQELCFADGFLDAQQSAAK